MPPKGNKNPVKLEERRISIIDLKTSIDSLIDIINPLDGKGGLVLLISRLKFQVNILWGVNCFFLIYMFKDYIGDKIK